MIHRFKVYGKVRGQGRPRVNYSRRSTYKPNEDKKWERKIKEEYINSGGMHFGDKPIAMAVISHRAIPESYSKKIIEEPDTIKPDASNILKSVEDALNKIAYYDDKQIVCAIPLKKKRKRDQREHLEIIISDEFDEEKLEEIIRRLF